MRDEDRSGDISHCQNLQSFKNVNLTNERVSSSYTPLLAGQHAPLHVICVQVLSG